MDRRAAARALVMVIATDAPVDARNGTDRSAIMGLRAHGRDRTAATTRSLFNKRLCTARKRRDVSAFVAMIGDREGDHQPAIPGTTVTGNDHTAEAFNRQNSQSKKTRQIPDRRTDRWCSSAEVCRC
jgi:hypothetical protein